MRDLTTYAKAMGNGYPVACFGGRADVMDVMGSGGGVVHGGTYTANLVALSAANATLDILANTDALETVDRVEIHQGSLGTRIHPFWNRTQICRALLLCLVFISEIMFRNYRDWKSTDSDLYTAFAWQLIEHGVILNLILENLGLFVKLIKIWISAG